jgi:predicted O-methyltransferase YrrM
MEDRWNEVDAYVGETLIGDDSALENVLRASDAAGLPKIAVSPAQGKFLFLLARMIRARRILEIGTLGGYSAIWMARGLARGGRLVTLEIDKAHAAVAWSNIVAAGFGERIDLRIAPALESLDAMAKERVPAFDLVFIDADKPSIPEYVRRVLPMCREGSVLVIDNVVRGGKLADAASDDAAVRGVRALHEFLAGEKRIAATTLQTVGVKGYDGFTLAVVDGDRRSGR